MTGKEDNEWAAGPEDDEDAFSRKRPAGERRSPMTDLDLIRKVAREQFTKGWEEVGVDFSTFQGRQEHGALILWMRERKAAREAGVSKVWTTAIGATVSALIAGLVAYLTGKHPG